jgi:hypothetical protein
MSRHQEGAVMITDTKLPDPNADDQDEGVFESFESNRVNPLDCSQDE